MSGKPIKDRRVERTRTHLHEALMSLIRQKDYDDIVVKEILDEANVGRSTFYAHFRDKDDLLVSGIHEMLQPARSVRGTFSGKPYEELISFSLPIFEHHYEHRRSGEGRVGARGRAILHEHLQRVLAARIDRKIKDVVRGQRKRTAGNIPPDLLVGFLASTFVLVLNWWLDGECVLSPGQVNELFRTLVLPTLAAFSR
jgi:AcrR family transcriptional regulator